MLEKFPKKIGYTDEIEFYITKIEKLLTYDYKIAKRAIALLLLQEDEEILELVKSKEKNFKEILNIINELKNTYHQPISYIISILRQREASDITKDVIVFSDKKRNTFRKKLEEIFINPFIGGPILLFILYYSLYKFVGVFGAGILVDFLESKFENFINPFFVNLVEKYINFKPIVDLLVGDYGIITLGFRYAFAIILPIISTFFFVFAIIEDSGYLPRLAMLVDRLFKKIGLSGRAVIPLILGFGCDTMATIVTRTLPTKREKIIATLLLALAVPCSAQMGVIFALLSSKPHALVIWFFVIFFVFLIVGFLSSKILPGERPTFYMEIPPLRFPAFKNVFLKTFTRLKWYFLEVLPLFILASFLIWAGKLTGIFDLMVRLLEYPVRFIGLPKETSVAFLFGFFRRDYGAAGLYDLKKADLLSTNQLVIASITLTLFLPCIAQFLVNLKERGYKSAFFISIFVLFFSFSVGFLVNLIFNFFKISL